MNDSRWERYAALGGIWFVVLNVVATFLPGAPPSNDDSVAKLTNYFSDHSGAIKGATLLLGLGLIGLFWWFGSLWRLMSKAEGDRPRLAVVALAGLVLGGAMALMGAAISSTVALRLDGIGDGVKFFFIFTFVLFAAGGFGIVIFVAAVTSLSWRTKLFASWVNVIGWLAALLFLIGSLGVLSDASWLGGLGLAAFLVWSVWIVAISVHLFRQTPAE